MEIGNTMKCIDLSRAGLGNFRRSRPRWVEVLWVIFELLFVTNPLQPLSKVRCFILRVFGAKVGKNIIIRPRVRIKFPWNLTVGDNCWIGEGVWIHNQGDIVVEENVVISQESFITTGSHDTRDTMELIVKPVLIRKGAWITSRCIVTQGVEIGENVIVTPGSVVKNTLLSNNIYGGNPVKYIKARWN